MTTICASRFLLIAIAIGKNAERRDFVASGWCSARAAWVAHKMLENGPEAARMRSILPLSAAQPIRTNP